MPTDLLSKVEKSASAVLADGERYVGAQPMTVKGPAALATLLAHLEIDEALPNHVAVHGEAQELTVADTDVPNAFLAAVTGERLLVFRRSLTGRPKDLAAEYPIGSVTLDVIDHGDRARARTFVFSTADGTVFAGDAGINGDDAERAADRFVDAFEQVTGR